MVHCKIIEKGIAPYFEMLVIKAKLLCCPNRIF